MSDNLVTFTITPAPIVTAIPLPGPSQVESVGTPAGGVSDGSSPPPPGAQGQGPPPIGVLFPGFDPGAFVLRVDFVLLCLIGLVVLLRSPRGLARLARPSNFFKNGHILRSATPQRLIRPVGGISGAGQFAMPREKSDMVSDDSHTLQTHEYQYTKTGHHVRSVSLPQGPPANYPPHVSSCPAFLRSLVKPLSFRTGPGFTLGQVFACLFFLVASVFPAMYNSTGPAWDNVRPGMIAGAQLPFVFAFATKNNIFGALLGMGYEKLQFLHQFVAVGILFSVLFHVLGYFYKWMLDGTFMQMLSVPSNFWGLIGALCFKVLWLFSGPGTRQKAYNFFLTTHVISYSVLLVALYHHQPALIPYVYTIIGIHALDHLFRVIKTRFQTAVLTPISELGTTRLEVRGVNAGWRAGQHVRIRVFSVRMGIFGWSEAHPFTIANASGGEEGMVLMIKKVGGWTNRLYNIAQKAEHSAASGALGYDAGAKVKVIIEGPYGGPGPVEMSSYSAAVIVCGGSGISLGLAALEELVRKDSRGQSRLKLIELVWIARDPSQLVPLLPRFLALVQESLYTPIRVSVFYTRAPIGQFPFSEDLFKDPSKLNLSPGRPKFGAILDSTVNRTLANGSAPTQQKAMEKNCGVIVAVCGPAALADDVAREVNKVDSKRRDRVGGIELYEEAFGW